MEALTLYQNIWCCCGVVLAAVTKYLKAGVADHTWVQPEKNIVQFLCVGQRCFASDPYQIASLGRCLVLTVE